MSVCLFSAAELLNDIDFSVDPCEDFYTYACGKWNKRNLIPEDAPAFGNIIKQRNQLQKTLKRKYNISFVNTILNGISLMVKLNFIWDLQKDILFFFFQILMFQSIASFSLKSKEQSIKTVKNNCKSVEIV